jgi:hypothetical protein
MICHEYSMQPCVYHPITENFTHLAGMARYFLYLRRPSPAEVPSQRNKGGLKHKK